MQRFFTITFAPFTALARWLHFRWQQYRNWRQDRRAARRAARRINSENRDLQAVSRSNIQLQRRLQDAKLEIEHLKDVLGIKDDELRLQAEVLERHHARVKAEIAEHTRREQANLTTPPQGGGIFG